MKRHLSVLLLLCSTILLILSLYRTTDTKSYTDLLFGTAEFERIKSSRSSTSRELLEEISFNNIPAFYDELTESWFHTVSTYEPELNPSVGIKSEEKNLQIAFSEQLIPGKSTDMLAYTDSEYKAYTLVITTLPLIKIDCGEDFFTQMNEQWEEIQQHDLPKEQLPMRFTLIDNRPENPHAVTVSDGTIHIRGGSTLEFPKKSLRIKLLEKTAGKEMKEYQTALLGMRQDGGWLLYPAYNDQEKIRNVFSLNLWYNSCARDNSFGLINGMEYRFIELFLNRQYWGLYALGFPIDSKQMGIKADNRGFYDEYLLKQKAFGPDFSDIENGTHGIMLQQNAEQSDINNALQLIKTYFLQLQAQNENIIWQNDFDNVIDIWLFLKLGQASDTIMIANQLKNVFYTIKLSSEGRKILFTPWDADNYWGNTWSIYGKNKTNEYALSSDDNSLEMNLNPISYMKEKDTSIVSAIQRKYTELRSDNWSDHKIDEMLDGFEQDIYLSGAYLRDKERWPDGNYQDPDLKLALFRKYVHERFHSMDEYIAGL